MPISSEAEFKMRTDQYNKAKEQFYALEKEYLNQIHEFEVLSDNQKVACAVYVATASNHDREMWHHEVSGGRHDWSGRCHRKFVNLANSLLEKNDTDRLLNIFNTINTHLNKM